jgi:hypothetical protein
LRNGHGAIWISIGIFYGTVLRLLESPRRLIAKGRIEEAEKILVDVEDKDVDDLFMITQPRDFQ